MLLNRFITDARTKGYEIVQIEATDAKAFLTSFASEIRSTLYALSAKAKLAATITKALGVLKSFSMSVGLSDQSLKLSVDPRIGSADSGILDNDLTALLVAVGEAAASQDTGVLIAIDELQYLSSEQLAAIIVAIHRITQLALPVLVVGTGLPQLPALAGNAKSYAERLFTFPNISALNEADAFAAVRRPIEALGAEITTDAALVKIYAITRGYPYFIQEWAYSVWNSAARSPIDSDDVDRVEPLVLAQLDESFFRVRFDRLTPKEQAYLRAMAELGEGPHRSGEIAQMLHRQVESVSPMRGALIRKGMIFSLQHGDTGFTVPLFDERTMPVINPEANTSDSEPKETPNRKAPKR